MTAYHFFLANAGYSYDPSRETPIQGRRRCAKQYAEAEKAGREAGLSFEWTQDDITSAEFTDEEPSWLLWVCRCHNADGEIVESLAGIDFGRDGGPWGDSYRRVVEAELACEYLDGLEA